MRGSLAIGEAKAIMKGENRHIHIFGGKIFQAEERANAKALKQSGKEACRMGT